MEDCTLTIWDDTPQETLNMSIILKALDFGSPAIEKNISKIYVTVNDTSNISAALALYYRDNTSGSFTHIGTDMDVSGNHESVLIFVPNTIIKARIFQLKLTSVIQLNSDKFSITDISIEYRKLRDRSIGDASSE